MKDERYKELMAQVGLPNSCSLLQALQQCAMEAALDERSKLMTEVERPSDANCMAAMDDLRRRKGWKDVD